MKKRPFIILPLDGFETAEAALSALEKILAEESARELTAYVKVNDVVHNAQLSGPEFIRRLKSVIKRSGSKAKIFLDIKIADTKGTNKNTLKQYSSSLAMPDIVTIRSDCSLGGFLSIKDVLPNVKLALVSALTDMSKAECLRRFGMLPEEKINRDIRALVEEANHQGVPQPFDMVVCSPKELYSLFKDWGDSFEFIVPGIRDSWMNKGQQARTSGVKDSLDLGATYLVMGSQMTKGNPDKNIDAETSRKMTMIEAAKSWRLKMVPGDLLATLKNLAGYYYCGKRACCGQPLIGPLVAYAGTYNDNGTPKNYVGSHYVNLSVIENYPDILAEFADQLAYKIDDANLKPDVIAGVPTGGSFWGYMLAGVMNLRFVSVAKKKVVETKEDKGQREQSVFEITRHKILPGDKVIIVEDLTNNFSSTAKVVEAVKAAGGEVIGIACAFNRSVTVTGDSWEDLPVISLVQEEIPQYKQDDSEVVDLMEAGKVVWKAKESWPELEAAMKKNEAE